MKSSNYYNNNQIYETLDSKLKSESQKEAKHEYLKRILDPLKFGKNCMYADVYTKAI